MRHRVGTPLARWPTTPCAPPQRQGLANDRVDDPPTGFDGGVISEIVRGFENDPGRIQGFVRRRLIGNDTGVLACAE